MGVGVSRCIGVDVGVTGVWCGSRGEEVYDG